jgi:hypothetical protein
MTAQVQVKRRCFDHWKIETRMGIRLVCGGSEDQAKSEGDWPCGRLIDPVRETWDADHRIPRAHNGSDDPPNVRPLCEDCHDLKTTTQDIKSISKGKRQGGKHFGVIRKRGFR